MVEKMGKDLNFKGSAQPETWSLPGKGDSQTKERWQRQTSVTSGLIARHYWKDWQREPETRTFSVDTMVFKAWPVHSSPAYPPRHRGRQPGSPALVLGQFWKRAVRSLAASSGAGRDPTACKAQKRFPLPWGPSLVGQTEGLAEGTGALRQWLQALTPIDSAHPTAPPPSRGRRGSAGVNDQLEVKTPKKLQHESRNLSRWKLRAPVFSTVLSRPGCFLVFPPMYRADVEKDRKKWKELQILFSWALKSLQTVTAAMKLKDACYLEEKLWQT